MTLAIRTNGAIFLSRAQAIQIMAISILLKDDELGLFGEDSADALAALSDVGEEIALQIAGYPE